MKSIVVISPNYLDAIYKESRKYDFTLYGYGTFRHAINGLLKVNGSDILGFAFAGVHLPTPKSKDFKPMLKFLRMCSLMQADKKFVIYTDEEITPWKKILKDYSHIRFFETEPYDFVSDITINKSIFGSILLDNFDPYVMHKKETEISNWATPHLACVPLFAGTQMQCVSQVELLDTVELTLDNDSVYRRFHNEGAYLMVFREYLIRLLAGDNDGASECEVKIDDILEHQQSDTETVCALTALKNYIEEKTNV